MNNLHSALIVAVVALVTIGLRFLPFADKFQFFLRLSQRSLPLCLQRFGFGTGMTQLAVLLKLRPDLMGSVRAAEALLQTCIGFGLRQKEIQPPLLSVQLPEGFVVHHGLLFYELQGRGLFLSAVFLLLQDRQSLPGGL